MKLEIHKTGSVGSNPNCHYAETYQPENDADTLAIAAMARAIGQEYSGGKFYLRTKNISQRSGFPRSVGDTKEFITVQKNGLRQAALALVTNW